MRNLRLAVLFVLATFLAWGQADANKAQLSGTVLDPKGSLVPNASVKIRNTRTGLNRELTTNAQGEFRAVQLDPGSYEVVAQSSGFATTTLQDIVLNVGAAVSLNINLELQATTQTVEVAATMMNSDLPSPSTVLTTAAISDLPINGRRFQDLALLTPQVVVEPSRSQISFAGQRGINSNIMLDGADYNQPFFGGIPAANGRTASLPCRRALCRNFRPSLPDMVPSTGGRPAACST